MIKSKNILFISYDGMTDPLGQSQVIPYLAGLSARGYSFTILSCEKQKKFRLYEKNILQLLKSHKIKWAPVRYHKRPPVVSSVFDVLMLMRKAKQLHSIENFDMVHTRAGIPSLIGLWMKKTFGVKFLHDIREFYAESRIDGGLWNKHNFFYKQVYRFFQKKEIEEIKHCDGIVCLTYAAKKIIKAWPHYIAGTPVEVIPCSVDVNLFNPDAISIEKRLATKEEMNIEDGDLVISYLGSLGGWYLTDDMLSFCKVILDKIPVSKFLFITPHTEETVLSAAHKFNIPANKIIVQHAQRREVPLLLSLSDYSLFFIKPCYSKQSSSPTKHGEIMAMGIPVITNAGVGDVANIVEKYNSGIVLNNLTKQEFNNAVDIVSENFYSENLPANRADTRLAAIEYYNLENAISKYIRMYDKILNRHLQLHEVEE